MRIISVDGGGYLGMATAAFLECMEAKFEASCSQRFDLFCGTSTGAIIALALASGMSAAKVAELYEQIGTRVFTRPPLYERLVPKLRLVRQLFGPLHRNEPLRQALNDAFGDLTLGDLRARGKYVLITAYNVSSGSPTVFKTDHAKELTLHDRYLVRDVALASSAAPIYLPLVELVDPNTGIAERFCDGAILTSSPALLGYAEAVSHLGRAPAEISILSLGTPRVDLAEHPSSRTWGQSSLRRGLLGWKMGERIVSVTMDTGAKVNHFALQRIARATNCKYERVDMIAPPGIDLDTADLLATQGLRQVGISRGRDAAICERLAPFFTQGD